ncbi:hypothetical protein AB6T85_00785 [Erwinia sp. ACCC 02193]|uniref:Uncharacterized protein n=1 Tax=Erwinia aeris TaxID=3239803 RepID=A0ABV4E276_9GAMM
MDAPTENALRSVARSCRKEIISAKKGKPKSEHDRITTLLLDKYTKLITALPPGNFTTKRWLTYYVRVVDKEMK